MKRAQISTVVVLSCTMLPVLAHAAEPPQVVYFAKRDSRTGASGVEVTRSATMADQAPTVLLAAPDTGALVVSDDGSQWAMLYRQSLYGQPLRIDDKAVTKAGGPGIIAVGTKSNVVSTISSGTGCVLKGKFCELAPAYVLSNGTFFAYERRSSGTKIVQWVVAGKGKSNVVYSGELQWDAQDKSAVSFRGDRFVVSTFDGNKDAVVTQVPIREEQYNGPAVRLGDVVLYLRREGAEQKVGIVEAYSLTKKTTETIHTASKEFPMWRLPWVRNHAGKSWLFALDDQHETAAVYETTGSGAAKQIAKDVHRIFDVSPDGKWLLATKKAGGTSPRGSTAIELVAIEIATGASVKYATGAALTDVNGAGFAN